jgi:dihydropyrimidine dehydrogenase (NAD+) subunit PreA
MERLAPGTVDPRTGQTVKDKHGDWTTHPNNPMRVAAE